MPFAVEARQLNCAGRAPPIPSRPLECCRTIPTVRSHPALPRPTCPSCASRVRLFVLLFSWRNLPAKCRVCSAVIYAEPHRSTLLVTSSVATALLFLAAWVLFAHGCLVALAVAVAIAFVWNVAYVFGRVRIVTPRDTAAARRNALIVITLTLLLGLFIVLTFAD
jgi:prepilin signal peptidase PulO-like enzyme (type II secretory pathway)